MNMFLGIFLCILMTILFSLYCTRDPLRHIPGPSLWQLIRNYETNPKKFHLLFSALKRDYGAIFKVPRLGEGPVLVLNDYDSIHHALVKEGKLFGGRPKSFRSNCILSNTGIIHNYDPDTTWKLLRKTLHGHLHQFGEGMSRLETLINDIANDMYREFSDHTGRPFNPKRVVLDTALKTIAFLIMGKRCSAGDKVAEDMREYEDLFLKALAVKASTQMKILDLFPWLRHFGVKSWKLILRILELESDIWQATESFSKSHPDADSIYNAFNQHILSKKVGATDAVKTTMAMVLAGVATTSTAFYAVLNILAHNVDHQNRIFSEIQKTKGEKDCGPNLKDKAEMPYTRAVIWEALRYSDVAPCSVHRSREETVIKGLQVPKDTMVIMMQWNLHKDEAFWGDPHTFRPERFLDDEGCIVSPSHPNRRHLVPFGAGPRVCVGEALAFSRLFIWLVNTVQRFHIRPAPGNLPSSTDARQFEYMTVLEPTPYEVIFQARSPTE